MRAITRRELCRLAAGACAALAACAACGCSMGAGSKSGATSQGFASDTEVLAGPVTVFLYADEALRRGLPSSSLGRVEDYFERYQQQAGREQVTFAIKYLSAQELRERAEEEGGFADASGVVALEDCVLAACDAGSLYGGSANTSVRTFTGQLYETLELVRAAGGSAQMPAACTATGEDSQDGQISRMQNLSQFNGRIAIPDEGLTEGMLANRVLARWGLYSSQSGRGGEFASELAGKLQVCKSLEVLCTALEKDECQLGFAVQSMLWGEYPQIEQVYQPSFGQLYYCGASVPEAPAAAVARDFFEYVIHCI
ncbi:MAG: hypothetical protein ACI36Y_08125 [Coriobacteriales bacterium]